MSLILEESGERKRRAKGIVEFLLHSRYRARAGLSEYLGDRGCYPHFKIRKLTSDVKQFIQEHQVSGATGIFLSPNC